MVVVGAFYAFVFGAAALLSFSFPWPAADVPFLFPSLGSFATHHREHET